MSIVKNISSRAGTKNRPNIVSNKQPILVTAPIVRGYVTNHPTYGWNGKFVVRGSTLSATPGVWEDEDGYSEVVGRWVDWQGNPISDINQLTYTVSLCSPLAHSVVWSETTIQFSLSNKYHFDYCVVVDPPSKPYWNGTPVSITGSHYPGSTLTKPTYSWYSRLNVTTSGEWWKNNQPTGVTTDTYSDTIEGDTLYWVETAFDGFSYSDPNRGVWTNGETSDYGKFRVNSNIYYPVTAINESVDSRISGLSGGKTYMKRFSVKDHVNSVYEWNPNLWCYDLRQQLSCVSAYKTGIIRGPEDSGGVLITPRHVLYCNHSLPHAGGTWPVSYNNLTPLTHRFVLEDNTTVDCVQIHQAGNRNIDLAVGVLDRNVEELGVHVCPIMPYDNLEWSSILELNRTSLSSLPIMAVSQGYNTNIVNEPWSLPVSDYDYPDHDVLVYIVDWFNKRQNINTLVPPISTYLHFNYAVYQGDSGTQAFIILDDTIYLHSILTSGSWAGPIPSNYISEINNLILQADLSAVSMGRLDSPTGYTVSRAPYPS